MKIAVVGGSGSGMYASIFLKRKHPDADVTLFDQCPVFGKKLLATGNGRCNLLHDNPKPEDYWNGSFVSHILEKHPFSQLKKELADLGIELSLEEGGLYYPVHYSAKEYVKTLLAICQKVGINLRPSSCIEDYEIGKEIRLKVNGGYEKFDKVIFATGGKSQSKLGSDGNLFKVFEKHGYRIVPLMPSLTPLVVNEKVGEAFGERVKCSLKLFLNEMNVFQERGEVLFKKDGISGIVVFNASRHVSHQQGKMKASVEIDFFPELDISSLEEKMERSCQTQGEEYLQSYLTNGIAKLVKKRAKTGGIHEIASICKHFDLSVKSTYGFDSSQVTSGGISVKEVRPDLSSSKEKGVYFIGEVLDIDGPCGGYNLTWCLLSALEVASSI